MEVTCVTWLWRATERCAPSSVGDDDINKDDTYRCHFLFDHRLTCAAVNGSMTTDGHMHQFDSWELFIKEPQASTRHMLPAAPIQLVAGETSFTALLSDSMMGEGFVYTWGDARHHHLGRRVDNELSSASIPILVNDLGGIPVKKIASGGCITAAVSVFNDLCLWGGRPGEEQRIIALPVSVRSSDNDDDDDHHGLVNLVNITDPDDNDDDDADVKESLDIVDVAVGQGHVIALSNDHQLWAIGRGHNGQLGHPLDGPLFFAPE